jgi:hypothetical protein
MANCYQCGKEIGWFNKKNRSGNRGYIFDCPHCGAESTEHLFTNLAYIVVLLLPLAAIIFFAKKDMLQIIIAVTLWGIIYLPLSRFLWWKYVARLAKPFTFNLF